MDEILTSKEMKRRLAVRGYTEQELDAEFPDEDKLKEFYTQVFLQAKNFGNDLQDDEKEVQKYKLSKSEQKLADEIEKGEKGSQKKLVSGMRKILTEGAPVEHEPKQIKNKSVTSMLDSLDEELGDEEAE